MKIVFCSHDGHNYFGGPYEWAKRIGREWRRRGYEVVYLFLSDHAKEKSSVYQYVLGQGFEAHHLRRHSLLQWADNTEDRAKWFFLKTKRIKPDVFVANNILEALYACPQIEHLGIKTFGIYHTDDARHLWFRDLFVVNRLQGPSNIVYVSQLLHKKHGVGDCNFVIGCGAPLMGSRASYQQGPFKLVYAGKITNEAKQIIPNLLAFIEIVKRNPGLTLEFHIYGAGDKEKEVKRLAATWDKHIFFHGFMRLDQVQNELAKYHAFILLSDYEGLPIALMESMGVGLVPICLDIPSGIPELVDNGVNGFIVKDREVSFERAVMQLANDPALWERMSLAAKEKISLQYSTTAIADQWEKAFHTGKSGTRRGRLQLPEVHPLLIGQDVRKPGIVEFLKQQYYRIERRIKNVPKAI
ncbi:MAG: glycosyltransferase family 4 protein [Saprospiraceae bacterium]